MSTMKRTIRELLREETPLLLPAVHDALGSRLVERAGFRAYGIGGFALAGVRYGLPDVGLMSFGEAVAGVRDVMMGSTLPVLVDADDGYGDVKNVTRTVETYEALGAAGVILEDQTNPKRCGHMAGKSVVEADEAVRKLEAAVAARRSPDFFLVARTDARAVHGLDEAIRRGRRYLETGVDALFVEAPESVEELEIVGKSFGAPLLANMAEGGRTPILPPAELARLGFSIVLYPATILLTMIRAVEDALEHLRKGRVDLPPGTMSFRSLTELFGLERWARIEDRSRGKGS
jgi:2-methylisocitrate lyase-like PEP mutase family enzyme